MRGGAVLSVFLLGSGCTSTLQLTRGAAPNIEVLGSRSIALELRSDTKEKVVNSVFSTLTGGLNVPTDAEPSVRARVTARLAAEAGIGVCTTPPCGEGTLQLTITESSFGVEATKRGELAFCRVTARLRFVRPNGAIAFEDTVWSRQTDATVLAPALLERAANGVAGVVVSEFLPSKVTVSLPVEDDGLLAPGAAALLAGDLDGAERDFSELTQVHPDLAGAFYDLGLVAEVRGEYSKAALLHRRAATLHPIRRYLDAAESAERDSVRFAPRPLP